MDNIKVERQEPLELPNFDAFAENSEQEDYSGSEMEDSEMGSEEPELTEAEITERKKLAMLKIQKYEASGIHKPNRLLGFDSSLAELENEADYGEIKFHRKAGVNWARHALILSTYGMELAAEKFNPDSQLIGWSASVKSESNVGDYDEVLEELYIKYANDAGQFPPEMKLAFALVMSATNHCSKTREIDAQFLKRKQQFQQPQNQEWHNGNLNTNNSSIIQEVKEDTEIKPWSGISQNTAEAFENLQKESKKKKK